MIALALALVFAQEGVPPARPATPELAGRVAPGLDGAAELVLIGDTGDDTPLVPRWSAALKKETAPAVIVLGDLVYPQAPPCPTGVPSAAARAELDARVEAPFAATGKEVFLALGNHDISWVDDEPPRHLCVINRFAKDPQVRLPAAYYAVDLGPAILIVLNTNALADPEGGADADAQGAFAKAVVAAHPGKRVVMGGHHVLRTYHDKTDEDLVAPWLAKHGLRPDIWVNGHAHLLQMVVRDGLPGVTSGTASRPRERPACDRAAQSGDCGDDELWGASTPGYAVLRIERGGNGEGGSLSLTFKDVDGKPLWSWREPAKAKTP